MPHEIYLMYGLQTNKSSLSSMRCQFLLHAIAHNDDILQLGVCCRKSNQSEMDFQRKVIHLSVLFMVIAGFITIRKTVIYSVVHQTKIRTWLVLRIISNTNIKINLLFLIFLLRTFLNVTIRKGSRLCSKYSAQYLSVCGFLVLYEKQFAF